MPAEVPTSDPNFPDSDYRFVVLGHPELGEFLEWDPAVAAAWSVTKPGAAKRVEVTLAPHGLVQVRTEDPVNDRFQVTTYRTRGKKWAVKIVDPVNGHELVMADFATEQEAQEYARRALDVSRDPGEDLTVTQLAKRLNDAL